MEITETASGAAVYTAPAAQTFNTLDPRVAWLINDILSDDSARELSFGRNSLLRLDRTVAAKTGTTNNFRDNWTVGYTPELVTGVWIGNVNQSPMVNVTGITGAGPVWHQFMRSVLAGRADVPFTRPDGIRQVEICTLSGLLPSADCPYTRLEWFLNEAVPTASDSFYRQVRIDKRTNTLATSRTPSDQLSSLLVLDLPPAAHGWAREQNIPLLVDLEAMQAELALTAESNTTEQENGPILAISNPSPNVIYRIAPSIPAEVQKIEISAITDMAPAELLVLLNGQPLQTFTSPPYSLFWQLEVGRYDLVARALFADGSVQESQPLFFEVGLPEGEFVPDEE